MAVIVVVVAAVRGVCVENCAHVVVSVNLVL
jgi:hypothetical protein